MKRSFRIAYCVLFFVLICLPSALMPFLRNDAGLEKRDPVPFPPFVSDGHLNQDFSDGFEAWMNDRLPLRAVLLTASNTIRGELLREQSANVIVGRDGWLFFASEAPDYLGTNVLSDEQLRTAAVSLSLMREKTEASGGRFLFAPVPNKSSVCSDRMPSFYRKADESNLTRLLALLPEYGVPYADLQAVLSEAGGTAVYHRRDSHWNYRGALIGANAILDALGREHDAHEGASFSEERIWRGDLDKLLLPAGGVMDLQTVWDVRHDDFRFTEPKGVKDTQEQLRVFMSDLELHDASFSVKNLERKDGSRLFMARDSFGRALLPWMIDAYEEAVFRRTDVPEIETLAEGTDVILEIAERNISRLTRKAPFMYAPERDGINRTGLRAGNDLGVRREDSGFVRLYGAFPEGAETEDGRVFLLFEQDGKSRIFEAFPVRDASLSEEAGEYGFTAFFPREGVLSGTYQLTVIFGATAYPCGPVGF